VAVKQTGVPSHKTPEGVAVMATLTGRFGFTVMVMALEIAGLPEGHVILDVRTQVMISLFAGI